MTLEEKVAALLLFVTSLKEDQERMLNDLRLAKRISDPYGNGYKMGQINLCIQIQNLFEEKK
jgi:hypothetical protein